MIFHRIVFSLFPIVLSFTRHIVNLVIKINHLTVFQVDKRQMAIPPSENTWVFRPQPSIQNMLLLNTFSVTKQILTIANGPSITLGHVAVEARLNIDQQFHDHVRRILNKSLPSIVQIELLFMPIDVNIKSTFLFSLFSHFRLLLINNNCNHQQATMILILKFSIRYYHLNLLTRKLSQQDSYLSDWEHIKRLVLECMYVAI